MPALSILSIAASAAACTVQQPAGGQGVVGLVKGVESWTADSGWGKEVQVSGDRGLTRNVSLMPRGP